MASPATQRRVFGLPLEALSDLPPVLTTCIDYLDANKAYLLEGIFRVSGNKQRILELKAKFDSDGNVPLRKMKDVDNHIVSGLLKLWLRELPLSVIIPRYYSTFLKVYANQDHKLRLMNLRKLIGALPRVNKAVLFELLGFMKKVACHSDVNKMGVSNLAMVFAPTMMRAEKEDLVQIMEDHGKVMGTIEVFIEEFEYLSKGVEPAWFATYSYSAPAPNAPVTPAPGSATGERLLKLRTMSMSGPPPMLKSQSCSALPIRKPAPGVPNFSTPQLAPPSYGANSSTNTPNDTPSPTPPDTPTSTAVSRELGLMTSADEAKYASLSPFSAVTSLHSSFSTPSSPFTSGVASESSSTSSSPISSRSGSALSVFSESSSGSLTQTADTSPPLSKSSTSIPTPEPVASSPPKSPSSSPIAIPEGPGSSGGRSRALSRLSSQLTRSLSFSHKPRRGSLSRENSSSISSPEIIDPPSPTRSFNLRDSIFRLSRGYSSANDLEPNAEKATHDKQLHKQHSADVIRSTPPPTMMAWSSPSISPAISPSIPATSITNSAPSTPTISATTIGRPRPDMTPPENDPAIYQSHSAPTTPAVPLSVLEQGHSSRAARRRSPPNMLSTPPMNYPSTPPHTPSPNGPATPALSSSGNHLTMSSPRLFDTNQTPLVIRAVVPSAPSTPVLPPASPSSPSGDMSSPTLYLPHPHTPALVKTRSHPVTPSSSADHLLSIAPLELASKLAAVEDANSRDNNAWEDATLTKTASALDHALKGVSSSSSSSKHHRRKSGPLTTSSSSGHVSQPKPHAVISTSTSNPSISPDLASNQELSHRSGSSRHHRKSFHTSSSRHDSHHTSSSHSRSSSTISSTTLTGLSSSSSGRGSRIHSRASSPTKRQSRHSSIMESVPTRPRSPSAPTSPVHPLVAIDKQISLASSASSSPTAT
eukprot:TRINITY_DN5052_c0_g2_i1.p1 TRINITY_DN5052_c0_g2~~TRINITY_DN5052_c0_g2_i1.p1  ORF type:complete len:930 (+),score=212.41 TRINITY_DN5052_c0_g2_i1:116-2905(+)